MMTTRTKAILGLSGFFVAGALIGAAIVGMIVRDRVREVRDLRQHDGFLRFVERRLDLTVAQRDSLQSELDSLYAQLQRLRTTTARELGAVLDTFRVHVEPQLTPRQRELLQHQEEFLRRDLPHPRRGRHPIVGQPLPPPGLVVPPAPDTTRTAAERDRESGRPQPMRHARPIDSTGGTSSMPRPTATAPLAALDDSTMRGVDRLERRLARVNDLLKLSPQQQTAIRSIVASARERGRKVASEFSERPGYRYVEMRRIIGETRRGILEVLTHEQRRALHDEQALRRGPHRRR